MSKEKIDQEATKILKRIVKKRQELGITQFGLGSKLNLTHNGYFKIEKGKTKLDVKRLLEIAEILKVEPAYFFKD